MPTPPSTPSAPDASDDGLNARRLATADRLVAIGMELAEALRRQASEPGAPRVFGGDLALAFSRIARAVRLSVILAHRLDAGLAEAPAEARLAAHAAPARPSGAKTWTSPKPRAPAARAASATRTRRSG